jgi:hypothetical protein
MPEPTHIPPTLIPVEPVLLIPVSADRGAVRDRTGRVVAHCLFPELAEQVARLLNADARVIR